MFCPRCGQQQVSMEVRFCSRCGFLMTGLPEAITRGGMAEALEGLPAPRKSPRRRGVRQGGLMIFLGMFLVPMLLALAEIFRFSEDVALLAAIFFFLGGFLRMVYAVIFESGNPAEKTLEENVYQTAQTLFGKNKSAGALPPSQSIPVGTYAPPRTANWRDTNDLEMAASVTDETTKLLNKTQ